MPNALRLPGFTLPLLAALPLLAILLSACGPGTGPDYAPSYEATPAPSPARQVVYTLGVHPLHNPQRLFEVYQPLVDHLNRHLDGAQIRLEASRDYPAYDAKLLGRGFQLALPNPYQTVEAMRHGYRVFAKFGDDEGFRGLLLVRRDSGIREVADLKGKAVSYPAPSALAATMLPQWYLHTHGIDVRRDIENRYVGSQESAIMNAYHGHTAAAASWPLPWKKLARERPDVAQALEPKWQTDPLPNCSLMARDDVPPALIGQVRALLLDLHRHEEGRRILAEIGISRFEPASDASYAPVRRFVEQFEARIRPAREAK